METITLKDLKKRFYPNCKNQDFAKYMGISDSVRSEIMSGKYTCSARSKAWKGLCERVKNSFNLQLISENKFDLEHDKVEKIIRNLNQEIKRKDRIIAEQAEAIKELVLSVRVVKAAEQALEKGRFVLYKYENNKKKGGDI